VDVFAELTNGLGNLGREQRPITYFCRPRRSDATKRLTSRRSQICDPHAPRRAAIT